ncbi:MAG: hypothetical protein H6828_14500 [Planctomycetes bacterium]|nr:hypothetical protein [Planctomycetota bacterium]
MPRPLSAPVLSLLALALVLPLAACAAPSAPAPASVVRAPALALAPAQNLVLNGDFSRGTEHWLDARNKPLPPGPTRGAVSLDPRGGVDRSGGLRIDARGLRQSATAATEPFTVEAGKRYRLSFRGRSLTEQPAKFKAEVHWVTPQGRVRGGPPSRNALLVDGTFRPLGYDFVVPAGTRQVRLEFSAPSERAGVIDDVVVEELVGELDVVSFAPIRAAWSAGEAVELQASLVNRGGYALPMVRGEVVVGDAHVPVEVGDLEPGEVRQLALAVPVLSGGVHAARLTLRGRLGLPASATSTVLVRDAEPGRVTLTSGDARLAFERAGGEHALVVLEVRRGDAWTTRGVLPGLARVRIGGDDVDVLVTGEVRVEGDVARADVTAAGLRHRLSWRAAGDGWFALEAELDALRPVDLARYVFPELHAGWGAAGRRKHSAVFGGLEYLAADQLSSGTEATTLELAPRFVPHPYQVAFPAMAVADDGLVLGVTWDPEQAWDGRRRMPSTLFASPNRWMEQDDHLMALFLPSAPDFVRPGEDLARTPYTVRRGQSLRLTAELFALPAESGAEDALAAALRRRGAPPAQADWDAARARSAQAMLEAYDAKVPGWPYAGEEEPGFYSEVALTLLLYGLDAGGAAGKRALEQVDRATSAATARGDAWRFGLDLALHVGQVQRNLDQARNAAQRRLEGQRKDGAWGYEIDGTEHTKERLGAVGTPALGVSANHLAPILEYGRATGDLRMLRAASRGLEFTATLTVPNGSQTWEVPIGAPDLLSVQEGIDLELDAYEVTRDPAHLAEARRWARIGLAFVSTWEAPERPGQRYASTAVFGGSYFGEPWWGRPVQWIGLVYAGALLRLGEVDDALPWRRLAEGLVASCVEQQELGLAPEAHNPWPQAYADYYRLEDGLLLGKWLGPWTLVRQLNHLRGWRGSWLRVLVEEGRRNVHVTSAARPESLTLVDERLTAELAYAPRRACHTLLAPIEAPAAVRIDGKELAAQPDLDAVREGWLYLPDHQALVVKHAFARERLTLEVDGVRAPARGGRR